MDPMPSNVLTLTASTNKPYCFAGYWCVVFASVLLVGLQEPFPNQVKFILEAVPGYSKFHYPKFTDVTILYKTATFKQLEQGHWWLSPTPEKPSSRFGNVLPRIVVWIECRTQRIAKMAG